MLRRDQLTGFATLLLVLLAGGAREAPTARESKFIRYVRSGDDGGRLETSIVSYRNADGAVVDLVGAVHIADLEYFEHLNELFRGYDAVLYEMVKPRGMDVPSRRDAGDETPRGRLSWVAMFQRFLKDTLKLRYQLDEIDYERPNFVHADLDAESFFELQDARGESFTKLMMRAMLKEMSGGGSSGRIPEATMGEIITALRSPDRARLLKIALAKQFEQMEDLLAGIEGPKGSVILSERNKVAMKVVADRIAAGDRRIAVFYGAGHLKGMDRLLTEEMGFTQIGAPKWLVAWDMTPPPATQPATAPALSR